MLFYGTRSDTLTFVVHFVMRAFWAGVVGLHTVYTEGIRYEHLPWQTDFTREQMRQRFGSLSLFTSSFWHLSFTKSTVKARLRRTT